MGTTMRWTSADLEALPNNNGNRHEIIDGELYMSKQPHWHHQFICFQLATQLNTWSKATNLGQTNIAPGVIFTDENDVAPDLIWISAERLADALDAAGHLHAVPELVVEVLSLGSVNVRRDRLVKLKLYSQQGVQEYWIVDWQLRRIEIYRRHDMVLEYVATLQSGDTLETTLLPGFSCSIASLFETLPECPPVMP
ncbi:MAG TPA: Uma2 family endonuclease [Pyrinomonadaceae bacterium]|nr:Uma2 family endonuclease [Pyrinomonadaceae bacterium]